MNTIHLPEPVKTGGRPYLDLLRERHSSRSFSSESVSLQTLSDMLWASWGYNGEKKRTAPSSHNRQELEIYVAVADGVYLWNAAQNDLIQVDERDLRRMTGMQEFVGTAPVEIIYVAESSRITGKDERGVIETVFIDTGFISENMYLFCAQAGLITVVRALFDRKALSAALNLRSDQMITMVQSVGYHK